MDFRKEVIQKGIVYLNVFPYVIWEMQDAINDCIDGQLTANDGTPGGNSVQAWDEAVAFYTGSAEGKNKGGNNGLKSCSDGKVLPTVHACGQAMQELWHLHRRQ